MPHPPVRFVILSAARTGSNLLRHALASHPDIFVGGELFNDRLITQGTIPWYEKIGAPWNERVKINSDETLNALRATDPVQFINRLTDITSDWGYGVIGFKWLYHLPSPDDPVGQHLVADKSLRIIHLKRRNLLRRYLSWERAIATDKWFQKKGDNKQQLPAITLSMASLLQDITTTEAAEREYDRCLKDHPVLELFYEDLETDPRTVAAQALTFLGADPSQELDVLLEKTGLDPLRDAIVNYDELKSSMLRWASFFSD